MIKMVMKTKANHQSQRKKTWMGYQRCSSNHTRSSNVKKGWRAPSLPSFPSLHLLGGFLWPLCFYSRFLSFQKFTFVTAVGVWVLILIYFKVWFKFGNCIRLLTFISGGVFWSSMKWVLIDRQVAMEIAVTAETRTVFCTLPLSGKGLWDILKIV